MKKCNITQAHSLEKVKQRNFRAFIGGSNSYHISTIFCTGFIISFGTVFMFVSLSFQAVQLFRYITLAPDSDLDKMPRRAIPENAYNCLKLHILTINVMCFI